MVLNTKHNGQVKSFFLKLEFLTKSNLKKFVIYQNLH